jgi:hypothetical protein
MKYELLKSIVAAQKTAIPVKAPSPSFFLRTEPAGDYVHPTFTKKEFPTQRPAILLIEAVGASGKTAAARTLAYDTGLPIFDLAAHMPVAASTLTGELTKAFDVTNIGAVLGGIRTGAFGVIIDGIDEARSKTTEQAFEAFLNDIVGLTQGATAPGVIILGRGQVLFSTWCHLVDAGADVGLVEIDPFDEAQAKAYIDKKVKNVSEGQRPNYIKARDSVLSRLGAAFRANDDGKKDAFLSFIGYPPVLEAVATLLQEETNYFKIEKQLTANGDGSMEVNLLIRICDYLLVREKEQKAYPNFIKGLLDSADDKYAEELKALLYSGPEQCARVLARALGKPLGKQLIERDSGLNDRYEQQVETWNAEHPFLHDGKLRNVVFEAVAIANCVTSDVEEYLALALEYTSKHTVSYHLLYVLEILAAGRQIDQRCFNMLMQACGEFLGTKSTIQIDVQGTSWEEVDPGKEQGNDASDLEMTIEFPESEQERTFRFDGVSKPSSSLVFGPMLINTNITLPGNVVLKGRPGLETVGVCSISAREIEIQGTDLVVRALAPIKDQNTSGEPGLALTAAVIKGHVDQELLNGATMQLECAKSEVGYPLQKYVTLIRLPDYDDDMRFKYLRARRILMEFRSHSKGVLARYRAKIEHQRVVKNDYGRRVLAALVKEGVLRTDTKFYYVDSTKQAKIIGLDYPQLRKQQTSAQLEAFLRRIK